MKTTSKKTTALAARAISLFCAVLVLGSIQLAKASDLPEAAAKPVRGTCAFSLQLQKSVAAQREYLVKLDQARAVTETARNSVEEAYGNVNQANSSRKETPEVAWAVSEVGFGLE